MLSAVSVSQKQLENGKKLAFKETPTTSNKTLRTEPYGMTI